MNEYERDRQIVKTVNEYERERDRQIVLEAQKQREHEMVLAQQEHMHFSEMARIRRDVSRQRLTAGSVIFGVAIFLATIIAITVMVMHNDQVTRQQQRATLETCVSNGGAWINNNCIPTQVKPETK